MKEYLPPLVPDELQSLITDNVMAAHLEWSQKEWADFKHEVPKPRVFKAGDRSIEVVVIPGDAEAGVNVIIQQHQQAWKPSMAVPAMFHHRVNNPDGLTIVLPNNSVEASYYHLNDGELDTLHAGDMRPFYELQALTLESIQRRFGKFGKTMVAGNSLGGLMAFGVASVGPAFDITEIVSVEAPNAERTTKELSNDFLASGGGFIVGQRAAIKESGLPLMRQIQRPDRLALDYLRFALASRMSENRAILSGMASPKFIDLIRTSGINYPDVRVRIGWAEKSKVFRPELLETTEARDLFDGMKINTEYYTGKGAHAHATVDNPVAVALMLRRSAA